MIADVNKSELLRRLEQEYTRLRSLLLELSAEELREPGVVADWSIKDLVAHVIAHEQRALQELRYALRGEGLAIDHSQNDQFNAQAVAASRSRSPEQVLNDWECSYREIIAAVEALSEADFNRSSPVVQALGDTLDGALGTNTYGHYVEHFEHIQAWLKTRTGRRR